MSQGQNVSQIFLAITRNSIDRERLQGALAPLGLILQAFARALSSSLE